MKTLILITLLVFSSTVVADRPASINYTFTKPTSVKHDTVREFILANAPRGAKFERNQKRLRTHPFEIDSKDFSVTIVVKQPRRHKVNLWLYKVGMFDKKATEIEAANAKILADSINQTNKDNRVRDVLRIDRAPVFDASMEGLGPKWDFPKTLPLLIKKAGTYTFNNVEPGMYRIFVEAGPESDIGIGPFPGKPPHPNKRGR